MNNLHEDLLAILPAHVILTENLEKYAKDETEDLCYMPHVVVIAENAEQISAVLKYANTHNIPVTPRGAGTGLSGAALPIHGGILLCTEKLNKILNLDLQNLQITVESGVITQNIIDAAADNNLLYPIDPSSKGSCFIGGNIAHGSGGPRVVKYGTIRDYVLNLEVVLPTGEIIWTGANTLKNASGYSLTQLMIGSEGTLGIITKAVLKLIPAPKADVLLWVGFGSVEAATEAVSAVFNGGYMPSAVEYMESAAIQLIIDFENIPYKPLANAEAYLMIELSGNDNEALRHEAMAIAEILETYKPLDILLADTAAQKDLFWKIRRNISYAVRHQSVYKEEDTVVPRAALPALVAGLKKIGQAYNFESVCYGHAGDGNLHINILKGDLTDNQWTVELPKAITELFELTVSLGGTISGEHGIGLVQKQYLPIKYNALEINLMRGIKKVFDPNGILNMGKIFD